MPTRFATIFLWMSEVSYFLFHDIIDYMPNMITIHSAALALIIDTRKQQTNVLSHL